MNTMKPLISAGVGLLALAATLPAAPLQREHLPADAKWLLHLDLDSFRTTQLGQFVCQEILDKQLAKPMADLKLYLNLDLDWRKVNSLTAFGVDYDSKSRDNGVLVLRSTLQIQDTFESFLKRQADAAPPDGGPLKKLASAPAPMYSINNQLMVALPGKDLVLLSKSRAQVERASEVLAGQRPNLAANQAFSGYPPAPGAFFFMGLAEALNQDAKLPPQANVLKMANGGRLIMGEKKDQLYLQLALRAKSPEVTQQIQQVMQGLIALLSLSQSENQDLMSLVKATTVQSDKELVTVQVDYPVEKVVEKIAAGVRYRMHGPPKSHGKAAEKPAAEEETP